MCVLVHTDLYPLAQAGDVQPQNFGVHTAWRKARVTGILGDNALLGVRHQEEEEVLVPPYERDCKSEPIPIVSHV